MKLGAPSQLAADKVTGTKVWGARKDRGYATRRIGLMTVELDNFWLWAYVSSSFEKWLSVSGLAGDPKWLTTAQMPWQGNLVRQ